MYFQYAFRPSESNMHYEIVFHDNQLQLTKIEVVP